MPVKVMDPVSLLTYLIKSESMRFKNDLLDSHSQQSVTLEAPCTEAGPSWGL